MWCFKHGSALIITFAFEINSLGSLRIRDCRKSHLGNQELHVRIVDYKTQTSLSWLVFLYCRGKQPKYYIPQVYLQVGISWSNFHEADVPVRDLKWWWNNNFAFSNIWFHKVWPQGGERMLALMTPCSDLRQLCEE